MKEASLPASRFHRTKRCIIWSTVVSLCALAMILGLAIGLTRKSQSSPSENDALRNFPEQFILSGNNFTITNQPTTRYYEFNITQRNGSPDGFERTMLVVNNQFPGPLIECNIGDRIVVKVNNQLPDGQGTSIHWHGMFQTNTTWMDGTVGVTQCPIPPGESFTYNFTISDQRGTYWWHSHAKGQYTDGIVGPLIVHDPNEGFMNDYDEDIIVMISDWYHELSPISLAQYANADNTEGDEPVPENGLINGLNVFNCNGSTNSSIPCTGGAAANFTFVPGKRYRIRLINTGAFAEFDFSIDGHKLTVVEADGVAMKPVAIDRVPIQVAQRYSLIVEANQTVGNYWMRAIINQNCLAYTNDALNPVVLAAVHYEGANGTTPNSSDPGYSDPVDCVDLDPSDLKPVDGMDAPPYDVSYYIEASFQAIREDRIRYGYMNTTSWSPLQNTSTLQQANAGVTTFDTNTQFVLTPPDNATVIQLIIQNFDDGSHPFHLHGHTFWLLGTGGGYYASNTNLNTTNPVRRDTGTVPAFGYAIIRFIPHPGMWLFHCHLVWHHLMGLAMQIQYQPSVIRTFDVPQDWKNLCPS
ncbi:Cupredoxin [Umbelopsis sp. AD052]|nr:Cupredoxin [Umbelopsis sp. AD052]